MHIWERSWLCIQTYFSLRLWYAAFWSQSLINTQMEFTSSVRGFTNRILFLYYIIHAARGMLQNTYGLVGTAPQQKSLAATSHFFLFIGVMKNSEYTSSPLSCSRSRLSISLPPHRSPNAIRLSRLRESHSEDMAAHSGWAQIDSSMSWDGMQSV